MLGHLFIELKQKKTKQNQKKKKKKNSFWDILKYNSLTIWNIENSKEVKFKRQQNWKNET